ncbi:MAG: hypothetical protein AB7I19_06975 [Planctomycetota bacterium]
MTTILRCLPLCFALGFAACSSNTNLAADGTDAGDESLGYREIFADDLRGELRVSSPVTRRTEQNLLEVRVPIHNIAGKDLRLMAQMQFIDEFGAPNGDETNREYLILPRGGMHTFATTSRTSSARDYKLFIWKADR